MIKDFIKGIYMGFRIVLKSIAESSYQYNLYGLEKTDRTLFFNPMK